MRLHRKAVWRLKGRRWKFVDEAELGAGKRFLDLIQFLVETDLRGSGLLRGPRSGVLGGVRPNRIEEPGACEEGSWINRRRAKK